MTEFWSGWVDAHCHLVDPRFTDLDSVLDRSRSAGVRGFLMAGVDPEDWERQRQLAQNHSGLSPVFGLHPYFVASHSRADCDAALDRLARELHQSPGFLGETGLDFRSKLWNRDLDPELSDQQERQLHCFEAQLEIAEISGRAVVLHIVRAFDEAVRLLELRGLPRKGGFVHAFNGSAPQAESFLGLGLCLSIGGALCHPENHRLRQAVQRIPLDRILIESDSPDQAPVDWPMKQNEPHSILRVADEVARIKGCSREQVLEVAKDNLRRLWGASTISGD